MIHYDSGGELQTPTPAYEIAEIEDVYYLGESGWPVHHQTGQVIEALEPLAAVRLELDAHVTHVEMVHGGQAMSVVQHAPDQPYLLDVALEKRLRTGERTLIEWFSHLRYEVAPPPLFRRTVGERALESLGICVVFD